MSEIRLRNAKGAYLIAGLRLIAFCFATVALLVLGACGAIRGAPRPVITVVQERTDFKPYLIGDVLAKYYSADQKDRNNLTPVAWRDAVIAARLEITDQNFQIFKNRLYAETTGINLGVDLAALGLSGAAAVAGAGTAQALAAANTGVLGAGTSFNKETLYQSTLPAIFAQMEADRTAVLLRIRGSQALSDPTKYPLSMALADLSAYERAGTLVTAIQSLTTSATNTANTNKVKLEAITGLTVLPSDVEARREKFSDYIANDVVGKNDKTTLDSIVDALNAAFTLKIAKDPTIRTEGANVLIAVDQLVNGADAAKTMTTLSDKLNSVTHQTF